jgi:hypothetical protein
MPGWLAADRDGAGKSHARSQRAFAVQGPNVEREGIFAGPSLYLGIPGHSKLTGSKSFAKRVNIRPKCLTNKAPTLFPKASLDTQDAGRAAEPIHGGDNGEQVILLILAKPAKLEERLDDARLHFHEESEWSLAGRWIARPEVRWGRCRLVKSKRRVRCRTAVA